MTRFDYVEYLCGLRGCGREELLRAVVYIEQGGTCVSFMNTATGRWVSGEPIWKAARRGADIASSDALYAGTPVKCREAGAAPTWLDLVTLDIDLKPPPIVVERNSGRYVIKDRASGEEVKRVSEGRLKAAVKEVARRYGMPPIEVYDAMYWDGGEYPAWGYVLRKARRVMHMLRRLGADAMFVYSGAKGFHVKLVLPRLYYADLRPALARGLAQLLEVEVDSQTLDVRRKLRVPYTVNSKTGQEAFIFDPVTGEKIKELKWPKPVDPAFVGFLIQQPPRQTKPTARVEAPTQRKTSWVSLLEQVATANPDLKADCRKRFSALFGCACAVDGLDAELCIKRLAAALSFGELPREYVSAMERGFKVCAKRLTEGQKPLFSIRRALAQDVGEGEGEVWYSIKECITALPKLKWVAEEEQAVVPAEEQAPEEEPVAEAPQAPAAAIAETVQQAEGLATTAGAVEIAQPQPTPGLELEVAPPAALAEPPLPPPPESEESCLANPICANRLKLCIWKHLRHVPVEERKAVAQAEFERRGELFSRCLKDALEYARRESEP
jgi:hypothetical protein